ncbi:MAG TPA: transposase [Metabacillus sp.]|nr:transposase [Metabacillus sp.]
MPVTREPIGILPNRYKKMIKHYLSKYCANIEFVVTNMSPSFKAVVQQSLGKPVIIADRFHYVRYIYWADSVKRKNTISQARL